MSNINYEVNYIKWRIGFLQIINDTEPVSEIEKETLQKLKEKHPQYNSKILKELVQQGKIRPK